ncbi:hypothetical protein HQO24_19150 [Rhodococcus fascians]|nr:hypothetical protein [Rhodococcus fascians]MBY4398269.1 hypothetical protein [Rhodococcus fascians]MBY4406868.1 hypothetical protein [Rhodococcus fascians]MBY4423196.1 hypothetical protein [Rhodococcus fascians]MBY4462691.1 hypothetical protein [Rhodococcus fascians]
MEMAGRPGIEVEGLHFPSQHLTLALAALLPDRIDRGQRCAESIDVTDTSPEDSPSGGQQERHLARDAGSIGRKD